MTALPRSNDPIGPLFRKIRERLGLSLQTIEEKSDGRWKAVVVGSYERGDRRVTLERARELLAWYDGSRLEVLAPGDVVVRAAANAEGSTEHVEWLVLYGPNFDGVIVCDTDTEAKEIHSHWTGSALGYRTHHLGPITFSRGGS